MRTPLYTPPSVAHLRGRRIGICRAGELREGQEFRTVLTKREGYVLSVHKRRMVNGKPWGAVRVLVDGADPKDLTEITLHPNIIVEGL